MRDRLLFVTTICRCVTGCSISNTLLLKCQVFPRGMDFTRRPFTRSTLAVEALAALHLGHRGHLCGVLDRAGATIAGVRIFPGAASPAYSS